MSAGKADKLCHFVIASSSGLFVRWLQTEFGLSSHLNTVIIGIFPLINLTNSGDLDEVKAAMFFHEYVTYLKKK